MRRPTNTQPNDEIPVTLALGLPLVVVAERLPNRLPVRHTVSFSISFYRLSQPKSIALADAMAHWVPNPEDPKTVSMAERLPEPDADEVPNEQDADEVPRHGEDRVPFAAADEAPRHEGADEVPNAKS